jgi:hypothetical protein
MSWSVCTWQSLSSLVYHLLVIPRAHSRRRHLKGPPIGFALALTSNSQTWLERVFNGKPSSFYWALSLMTKEKSFITLTPGNVIKLLSLITKTFNRMFAQAIHFVPVMGETVMRLHRRAVQRHLVKSQLVECHSWKLITHIPSPNLAPVPSVEQCVLG